MGDEGDPLAKLRVGAEEGVEGSEATEHVLRQVGSVYPQDQMLATSGQHLLLGQRHPRGLGRGVSRSESIGSG